MPNPNEKEIGISVKIILRRGIIRPCNVCKRKYTCGMYKSLARNRSRNSEWMGATPILHNCNIYIPDKIPQDIKNPEAGRRHYGMIN